MASSWGAQLADPRLVVSFQRWCGVEFVDEEEEEEEDNHDGADVVTRSEAKKIGSKRPSVSGTRNGICPSAEPPPSSSAPKTTVGALGQKKAPTGNNNHHHYHNHNNNNNDCSKPSHQCNGIDHVKNGFDPHHFIINGSGSSRLNGMSSAARFWAESLHSGNTHSGGIQQRCQASKKVHPVCASGGASSSSPLKRKVAPGSNHLCGGKSPTRVSIRWPVLYYWARVGAFLGNEEFYLTGLPFLIWAVDSAMLRQTIMVWWLVMYLGQAGKDYFAWPRPPSPPVVRLETEHLAEYSMPSTHAMAGTAIPMLLAKLLLQRYQLPTVPVVGLAFLWCFTTCLSRLYLGVHTVLDVLSGFLVSLALYFIVSPLVSGYDLYQQTHLLSPLVLVLTSLALCTICYPAGPGVKTTGKSDAITTTAVVVGLGVGFWLNYQLGFTKMVPSPVNVPVAVPTLWWVATSLLQFVVGVVVVYGVKVVMKRLTVRFFSVFFGLDRPDAQHPGVMVGSTYTTYLCLGLVIAFFDPLLFARLGIGRPAFYLEVL